MHSDEIKQEIAKLNAEASGMWECLIEDGRDMSNPTEVQIQTLKTELLRVKADLLKTDALNELNWTLYYIKKEMEKNRTGERE